MKTTFYNLSKDMEEFYFATRFEPGIEDAYFIKNVNIEVLMDKPT